MELLNNFLYATFPRSSIAEMQFLYKMLLQLSCCDIWQLWIRLNRCIIYNAARTFMLFILILDSDMILQKPISAWKIPAYEHGCHIWKSRCHAISSTI